MGAIKGVKYSSRAEADKGWFASLRASVNLYIGYFGLLYLAPCFDIIMFFYFFLVR